MTEVAQVTADVSQSMEDVANEYEHDECDSATEKSAEESHDDGKKTPNVNDEASDKTDTAHVNGVDHKEEDTARETQGKSLAVNGKAQDPKEDDAPKDTDEARQNISDVALKQEVKQECRKKSVFC